MSLRRSRVGRRERSEALDYDALMGAERWVERDHRVDWATSKVTLVDVMDRLCGHDHDLKTRHGWALVNGRGKRAMVPPDDPRHPRNEHYERAGPAPPV